MRSKVNRRVGEPSQKKQTRRSSEPTSSQTEQLKAPRRWGRRSYSGRSAAALQNLDRHDIREDHEAIQRFHLIFSTIAIGHKRKKRVSPIFEVFQGQQRGLHRIPVERLCRLHGGREKKNMKTARSAPMSRSYSTKPYPYAECIEGGYAIEHSVKRTACFSRFQLALAMFFVKIQN